MAAAPVAQQAPEVLRSVDADVAACCREIGTQAACLSFSRCRHSGPSPAWRQRLSASPRPQSRSHRAAVNNAAAYAILKEIVDGPQWAADPAIYALDDLLPEPIGGDDANDPTEPDETAPSRNSAPMCSSLQEMTSTKPSPTASVLALDRTWTTRDPVYAAARLGAGFAASGVRAAQERCNRAARARGRRTRPAEESRHRRQHGSVPGTAGVHRRPELRHRSDCLRRRRRAATARRKRSADKSGIDERKRDLASARQCSCWRLGMPSASVVAGNLGVDPVTGNAADERLLQAG